MKTPKQITKQCLEHELAVNDMFLTIVQKMCDACLQKLVDKKLAKSTSLSINLVDLLDPILQPYFRLITGLFTGQLTEADEQLLRKLKIFSAFNDVSGAIDDACLRGIDDLELPQLKEYNWRKLLQKQTALAGTRLDKTLVAMRAETYQLIQEMIAENDGVITEKAQALLDQTMREEQETKRRQRAVNEVINQVVAEEGRISRQQAKQVLKDMINDYSVDVERIVQTELSLAYNNAKAEALKVAYGLTSPVVGFVDKMDDRETEECANWTWDGRRRRYYYLSSLKPPGYNLSRPRREWMNSVPPRHFGCRCIMMIVPDDFCIDPDTHVLRKLHDGEEIQIDQ